MMLEENDIELSLELSIGGRFGKSEKLIPVRQKSVSSSAGKFGETGVDLRSNLSRISGEGEEKEVQVGGEVLDPQRKREIHALRRQEARKKREEKQQKKGISIAGRGMKGGYVNGNVPMKTSSMDEKMLLEVQEYQSRVLGREGMENETTGSERIFKKAKVIDEEQHQDLNQISKQSQNPNPSSTFSSPPFPIVPMQYPYSNLEYLRFPNGFTFPNSVPYWAASPPPPTAPTTPAAVTDNKNVLQPIACQAHNSNANKNQSGSCDSEQNGGCKGGGSPGSSSSGVSDYQSTSHQG